MSFPNPLDRLRRQRPRGGWQRIVAEYVRDPLEFWGADKPRHAEKLERKKQAVRERDGSGEAELVDALLALAQRRRDDRPPPVYVTGLGGSGSHWVAGMLGDLGGMVPAGEVYLPRTLLTELVELDDADQAAAVDAIHLLHAWPRTADLADAAIINNAAGVNKVLSWKRWDPDASAFYLMRDPRDQVTSVTFRKRRFRRYEDPDASDLEYLQRMTRRNARAYRDYRAVSGHIDARWRYEDLCVDPGPMLREVLQLRGRPVDEALVERVATRHDAEAIRAGTGTTISNLDAGGRSVPWDEAADAAQLRVLHLGLVDVVHGLGYQPADCMGMTPPPVELPARTLAWASAPPGRVYHRDRRGRRDVVAWTPLGPDAAASAPDRSRPVAATGSANGVDVADGTEVLLRVGEDDDLYGLPRLGDGDVQALCLAANPTADDTTMKVVGGLDGLVALDVAGTAVTDAGLRALASLTSLRHLHVDDTDTTPPGRRALIEQLPNLTIRP